MMYTVYNLVFKNNKETCWNAVKAWCFSSIQRTWGALHIRERSRNCEGHNWLSSVIGAALIGEGSPSGADWEACLTKNALRISALSTSFSTRLPESSSKGGVNDGLLLVITARNWYRRGNLCDCGIAAAGSSRAD